jgi:LacI family transcriptional regulator
MLLEAELSSLRPAVVRSRFDFREKGRPADIVKVLDDIRHRGSMSVVLKADVPEITDAIASSTRPGFPSSHAPPRRTWLTGSSATAAVTC